MSRYRNRRFSPKPAVWLQATNDLTIGQVLTLGAEVERVWLVGLPHPRGRAGALAWASGALPEGWAESPAGHYLDGHYPTFRFIRPDGRPLDVQNAGLWFGDAAEADVCAAAWSYLERRVAQTWRDAVLLATPATTGRDLWVRSLGSREFPTLPDDLQHLIRSTSGQGRIETFEPGEGDQWRSRFVVYDARLAYAGCCRELGHGRPTWDTLDVFEEHARGRYLVTFEVPDGWGHVGLLAVPDPDGAGWTWPTSGRHQTWADGSELYVAGCAGWRFTIQARLMFPEHRGRPLDSWVGKLQALTSGREEPAAELRPLLRSAVRSMLLHAIGAFAGRPHKVSHSGRREDIGPDARGVTLDRATGLFQWFTEEPAAWPEASHPEWSSAIWARQRARLLTAPTGDRSTSAGLLSVHRSTLLGVRTDAIYMTADPGWPDDGRAGRYTLRTDVTADYRAPRTNSELWALRDRLEAN